MAEGIPTSAESQVPKSETIASPEGAGAALVQAEAAAQPVVINPESDTAAAEQLKQLKEKLRIGELPQNFTDIIRDYANSNFAPFEKTAREQLKDAGVTEADPRFNLALREKTFEVRNTMFASAVNVIKTFPEATQQLYAGQFLANTVGANEPASSEVERMYAEQFKGTPFGERMKELENRRREGKGLPLIP
jgi:hypothetical protein